jgi:molybdopterin molybdotransferase
MERIALEAGIKLLIEKNKIELEPVQKPLIEAMGEIIAEDVVAIHHQPPFDRSPLDGYAVRGEDTTHATKEAPVELTVIDEVCAGHVSDRQLESGQAIRIMTGGPMPKGSNGVIKQEDTDEGMTTVKIYKGIKAGQNYCYAGEDYKTDEVLLRAGECLSAYHIGLLASNGITEVPVKRKLRVGLMSTGDELLEPGTPLEAGKIYNSNLYTLKARLIELGCEPVVMGTIHDDVNRGMTLIDDIIDAIDMVVTTGGVSVGKMDIMHPIFEGLGVDRLFWRLQLKPGTPALAGLYEDKLILALSGNPSAAAITFELLFRPLLSHVTTCEDLNVKNIEGIMAVDFLKKSPTRRFIKAYVEGNQVYMTRGNQSSGALKSMIGCNCFIDVEAGADVLKIGDSVKLVLI